MDMAVVRIKDITIENFKNVKNGTINFECAKKVCAANILGLYGQNGSGKTALIDAISLLKYALTGLQVPDKYADFINVNEEKARIRYNLIVENVSADTSYNAVYEFSLKKMEEDANQNAEISNAIESKVKPVLFDEVLSCSYKSKTDKKIMKPLIDTRNTATFLPQKNYKLLTGNTDVETDVLVARKLATVNSRSFVFSKELLTIIRGHSKAPIYSMLIESLVQYGNFGLFICDTATSGLISLDSLPLTVKYGDVGMARIMLPLNNSTTIPQKAFDVVNNSIKNMNIVLTQIVPGLTISLKETGTEVLKNGEIGSKVQIVSHKNGKDISLKYESEGIKKIISILQLLIAVYNRKSITVAIDELDSGIFEYLLGEILRIISEKGKGQLVFTSHNLRPLETLDKSFVAFTTTNPNKRYIRFGNVKANNNLRSFYYRDIMLGEQSEQVYELTNNSEIALAFKEAGEGFGA